MKWPRSVLLYSRPTHSIIQIDYFGSRRPPLLCAHLDHLGGLTNVSNALHVLDVESNQISAEKYFVRAAFMFFLQFFNLIKLVICITNFEIAKCASIALVVYCRSWVCTESRTRVHTDAYVTVLIQCWVGFISTHCTFFVLFCPLECACALVARCRSTTEIFLFFVLSVSLVSRYIELQICNAHRHRDAISAACVLLY